MSDIQFRQGIKPFYDPIKFPRGFAKSGNFTLAEEQLLMRYGKTMQQLANKEISPENEEEEQFIASLNAPEMMSSKLEKVWFKYTQLTHTRKRFHTLNGKRKAEDSEEYIEGSATIDDD
jgi:uncharacterized protein YifE (UPF0438 family)